MAGAKRLAANVVLSWVANVVKVLVQLIMLPLMAHLLGPSEMGLYNLALPILTFVLVLSDGGLGNSLAREPITNDKTWSTAFWGLQISGLVLAGIVVGLSFFIGYYSHQPKLPYIMGGLSLTLILVASSIIPSARMMQLGKMGYGAIGDMLGNVIGAGVAIYVAESGGGAWAMVAQFVIAFFVRTLTFNFVAPYLPKFMFSFPALSSHFGIGGSITGGRLIDFAGRTIENSQLSRLLGAASLGAYGFANQVPRFVCDAATNPIWSNLYYLCLKNADISPRMLYLKHSRMVATIVFPATIFMAVVAKVLIDSFLGAKWHDAIFTMSVILLSYPFVTLGSQSGAVLLSRGVWKLPLAISVCSAFGRVLSVVVAGSFGLNAIAIGLAIVNVVTGVAYATFSARETEASVWDLIGYIKGPLISACFSGLLLAGVVSQITSLFLVIASTIICCIIYAGSLFVLDRKYVGEDIETVMALFMRKRA